MIFPSKLIEESVVVFSKFPGIGKKTALRLVMESFCKQIKRLQRNLQKLCNVCEMKLNIAKHAIMFPMMMFVVFVQVLIETKALFVW